MFVYLHECVYGTSYVCLTTWKPFLQLSWLHEKKNNNYERSKFTGLLLGMYFLVN